MRSRGRNKRHGGAWLGARRIYVHQHAPNRQQAHGLGSNSIRTWATTQRAWTARTSHLCCSQHLCLGARASHRPSYTRSSWTADGASTAANNSLMCNCGRVHKTLRCAGAQPKVHSSRTPVQGRRVGDKQENCPAAVVHNKVPSASTQGDRPCADSPMAKPFP